MNKHIETKEYIILLLATLIISYFTSCYSIFYNTSFLNYDSSIFYLIGRGIKNGYIPYIDLADHKGIYIFIINYLGAVISENKYIGIFIINLFINYLYMSITYRIIALFSQKRIINIMTAITSFVLATSYFFCQGGMKCETMLMPIILFANYLYIQHLINNDKERFNYKYIFVIGIGVGIVLFTKANLCICFLPIALSYAIKIFKEKRFKLLLASCLFGFLGVFVGIMPAIIYGFLSNSLKEMIYYTFTANVLYVKGIYYEYNGLMDAIINTIITFKWVLFFSILGIYASKKITKNIEVFFFVIFSFFANLIASFMALRPYTYHSYPMLINILWFILFIYNAIDKIANMIHNRVFIKKNNIITLFMIICTLLLSIYMYWFSYRKNIIQGYKQYLVNKEIEKYYNTGDSILVIGSAIGVYNYFDIFPTVKNFCVPYTTEKFIEPIYNELLKSIKDNKNDWVITSFTPLMNRSKFPINVNILLDENYDYIDDIPLAPATIYKKVKRTPLP